MLRPNQNPLVVTAGNDVVAAAAPMPSTFRTSPSASHPGGGKVREVFDTAAYVPSDSSWRNFLSVVVSMISKPLQLAREFFAVRHIANVLKTTEQESKEDKESDSQFVDSIFRAPHSIASLRILDRAIDKSGANPVDALLGLLHAFDRTELQALYVYGKLAQISDRHIHNADINSLTTLLAEVLSTPDPRWDAFALRVFRVLPPSKRDEFFLGCTANLSESRVHLLFPGVAQTQVFRAPKDVFAAFNNGAPAGSIGVTSGPVTPTDIGILSKLNFEVHVTRLATGHYVFSKGTETSASAMTLHFPQALSGGMHNHPLPGWVLPSGIVTDRDFTRNPYRPTGADGDLALPATSSKEFIVSETGLTEFEIVPIVATSKQHGAARLQLSNGDVRWICPNSEGHFDDKVLQPYLGDSFTVTGIWTPNGHAVKITYTPWPEDGTFESLGDEFREFCGSRASGSSLPHGIFEVTPPDVDRIINIAETCTTLLSPANRAEAQGAIDLARKLGDESLLVELAIILSGDHDPDLLEAAIHSAVSQQTLSATLQVISRHLDVVSDRLGQEFTSNLVRNLLQQTYPTIDDGIARFLSEKTLPDTVKAELVAHALKVPGIETSALTLLIISELPSSLVVDLLKEIVGDKKRFMLFHRVKVSSVMVEGVPKVGSAILNSSLSPDERLEVLKVACSNLEVEQVQELLSFPNSPVGLLPKNWEASLAMHCKETGRGGLANTIKDIEIRNGYRGSNAYLPRSAGKPREKTSEVQLSAKEAKAHLEGLFVEVEMVMKRAGEVCGELQAAGLSRGPLPSGVFIIRILEPDLYSRLCAATSGYVSALCRSARW